MFVNIVKVHKHYNLPFWYPGWSVLASIALSVNLRVVTFIQPYPSAFYQNRAREDVWLLFQLRIDTLRWVGNNTSILQKHRSVNNSLRLIATYWPPTRLQLFHGTDYFLMLWNDKEMWAITEKHPPLTCHRILMTSIEGCWVKTFQRTIVSGSHAYSSNIDTLNKQSEAFYQLTHASVKRLLQKG